MKLSTLLLTTSTIASVMAFSPAPIGRLAAPSRKDDQTSYSWPVATSTSLHAATRNSNNDRSKISFPVQCTKALAAAVACFTLSCTNPSILPHSTAANAADTARIVGTLQGSGLVFKDTLQIEAFEDPKVKGVELYISNFQIPLTERMSSGKNFFNDPSYASVACSRSKQVSIADNIAKGPAGEEVFEESKSLLFKTLRVQRIYDEEKKTVIYVSFNTRLDKGSDSNKSRFKSSLCAVNLE